MKAFWACLKKEFLDSARGGRITVLIILFAAFGVMNPAIAKLTPWMMEMMAESLEGSGLAVTEVTVDALTSWTQFFKNIPMALIIFAVMYSGIFTAEYSSGTLILMLTKGLSRYKVVLAKTVLLLSFWSVGYWLCLGITYGYNAYFWDNSIVAHLWVPVLQWWLFGIWVISLMVLFSTLSSTNVVVMLGIGGAVLLSYLVSLLPKVTPYMPTTLMNTAALMLGYEDGGDYIKAVAVTVLLTLVCVAGSIPLMNRKKL